MFNHPNRGVCTHTFTHSPDVDGAGENILHVNDNGNVLVSPNIGVPVHHEPRIENDGVEGKQIPSAEHAGEAEGARGHSFALVRDSDVPLDGALTDQHRSRSTHETHMPKLSLADELVGWKMYGCDLSKSPGKK